MSSTDELKKAHILVHDQNGNKTYNNPIKVLFNPGEYSIEKGNTYSSIGMPGKNEPVIQFIKGESEIFNCELFFDTYTYENSEDVRNYTNQVSDLMKIDPEIHAPKICTFEWGPLSFTGIIEKISTRFTMFKDLDGIPVRAVMNFSLKQIRTKTEEKETKLESPDKTKRFEVGEEFKGRLDLIAYQVYGDPSKWREIAKHNKITDPSNLPDTLTIPPLEKD